ncbi:hypothetical protein P691DRAFT_808083 [Macrolepiota fuliginosa MF-IS2]|uniref:F-box domain-containing protein n=1 Tax=Macrolepiota fuliginosa MF-IS2 TaxID=1400762 RepID=A0A9P6C7N1_9AGAR|nr:hypothetical protein P691DRAFT_808083 [Macrolepiota fuliginosa MF-IS2]
MNPISSSVTIDSLPIEILGEIFINCLEHSFYKRQVLLTSVSRSWRYVAHSCPQLWTEIYIDVDNTHPHIPHLQRCLQQSKGLPLDIRIYEGTSEIFGLSDSELGEYMERVGGALFQHIGRWKTFYLQQLSHHVPVTNFLIAVPFNLATQLEELDYMTRHGEIMSGLGQAPALRRLRCRWWGLTIDPLFLLPLQQVTHLDLSTYFSWGEIMQVVMLCTSLASLKLLSPSFASLSSLPKSISLPNLKGLIFASTTSVYALLPRLQCPNLCVLALGIAFEGAGDHYCDLFHFLANGNHKLQLLRLYDKRFPVDLLPTFFSIPRLADVYLLDLSYRLPENTGGDNNEAAYSRDFGKIKEAVDEVAKTLRNPNMPYLETLPEVKRGVNMRWLVKEKFLNVALTYHTLRDGDLMKLVDACHKEWIYI